MPSMPFSYRSNGRGFCPPPPAMGKVFFTPIPALAQTNIPVTLRVTNSLAQNGRVRRSRRLLLLRRPPGTSLTGRRRSMDATELRQTPSETCPWRYKVFCFRRILERLSQPPYKVLFDAFRREGRQPAMLDFLHGLRDAGLALEQFPCLELTGRLCSDAAATPKYDFDRRVLLVGKIEVLEFPFARPTTRSPCRSCSRRWSGPRRSDSCWARRSTRSTGRSCATRCRGSIHGGFGR